MTNQLFYRRHLPHYQIAGATLFVTFRLYGSIPGEVRCELEEIARQTHKMLSQLPDQERERRALIA